MTGTRAREAIIAKLAAPDGRFPVRRTTPRVLSWTMRMRKPPGPRSKNSVAIRLQNTPSATRASSPTSKPCLTRPNRASMR